MGYRTQPCQVSHRRACLREPLQRDQPHQLFRTIARNKPTYRGSLEVRWFREIPLYTMWIKDRNTEAALASIGVHLYRGDSYFPYFGLSKDSRDLIENLAAEFDYVWENASSPSPRPQSL